MIKQINQEWLCRKESTSSTRVWRNAWKINERINHTER